MHDIIGNDHVVPADFRAEARKQISFYNVTTFVDQKVTNIQPINNSFSATLANGTTFTARKVILGIFWCPWCDGFEHRGQTIGVLGNLSDAYDSVRELHPTLNKDIRVYSNSTNNPGQLARIASKDPNWEAVFKAYNVTTIDKPIQNITRVQDGSVTQTQASREEFDKFRVYFADETFEERGAFITNYATLQASELPSQLGVGLLGSKINTTARGLRTTVKGVWAIGDANSDNSTNVPHAMSSGKTAAVHCHVELATEELALTSGDSAKRDLINDGLSHERVEQQMGNEIEDIYNRLRRR
ncbi:alkyl hydroperoxide reductase subunit F [Aspergillus udagawae]|uniref:Alkyl hydroperoxide reductase subunit F n=1 Tax=Aspergillus udagawae TaxID=91492 RepID=A0ABQ1BD25_9EURO|nr:alkyl hydroperoxide reductase subunit F [Aspergillus udagawae]